MSRLKGWIISNGCLKTPKFMEIISLYEKAAQTLAVELRTVFNNEIMIGIEKNDLFCRGEKIKNLPDFVLFLDKDIRLACQLEKMGLRLFNSSRVIALCDDKSQTFQALAGCNVLMPKTIIAPLVFNGFTEDHNEYLDTIEAELNYPMVVKESYGSFGEQVYLVKKREELQEKRKELLSIPHIYQEFVANSKGRDVRINVVGNKMVAAMLRTSDLDFRANITNGGRMQSYNPPEAFKELALKVCELLGADFAGVDLLFGENEQPVLCEVNSNAHIKNIQQCTGINVAEHILEHIVKELSL